MIHDDRVLELAAHLRQKIILMLNSVENANGHFSDSSPNHSTRRVLFEAIDRFDAQVRELGGLRALDYAPCGSDNHERLAGAQRGQASGYWLTIVDRAVPRVSFDDRGRMTVDDVRMETSERIEDYEAPKCPCGYSRETHRTGVMSFYALPAGEGLSEIELIGEAAEHLRKAARLADRKTARGSIREEMLLALQALERAILPKRVEEYLWERKIVVADENL